MIVNIKNSFVLSFLAFLLSCGLAFSQQDNYIKHTVVQGETITQIAQKYKVTPFDIYKLNPDSQQGIQLNSILIIPANGSVTVTKPVAATSEPIRKASVHLVQPKETLYSLSKTYNITIEELKDANYELQKSDLKVGQELIIPPSDLAKSSYSNDVAVDYSSKNQGKTTQITQTSSQFTSNSAVKYHVIAPQETKYGISKMYSISIQDLERLNPEIVNDFPIGLKIAVSEKSATAITTNSFKPFTSSSSSSTTSTKMFIGKYVVQPNETVYSICKEKGISEQDLLDLNPELKEGLKLGMILRVPKKKETFSKTKIDLATTINNRQKKNLVLLLPFNISKIQSDTVNSTEARLKKDKFLNLTLDVYSGALMAIDSAKVLGLNVDVKIFDSQETKNSFGLDELVSNRNLENVDAIIGPFYQSNVEKLAEWLSNSTTAIISPLSKEYNKSYPNLYQSLPSEDKMRNTMFDFMRSKQGNIVAIIDSKKQSIYDYFSKNQPDVKIIGLSESGTLIADSLQTRLSKTKTNYVVLVTEKTSMIINATNIMQKFKQDYQMQMAILEYNETLDFEEVKLSSLTNLNMMYPSITKPNDSQTNTSFENSYKRRNNVFPNQFAVRGFDVTFDTLLRLSQEKTFEETIQNVTTEYVENKFDYIPSEKGYNNNGVYVLYYDNDLTIKEAK